VFCLKIYYPLIGALYLNTLIPRFSRFVLRDFPNTPCLRKNKNISLGPFNW